jgi:diguanylate cyclase (GGDEF)-like protein
MGLRRQPFGKAHLSFLLAAGTGGWILLFLASTLDSGLPDGVGPVRATPVTLFLLFCLLARFLAIESLKGMAISLDSAFYIAALWTLGPLPTAWIASVVLVVHGAWRTIRRHLEGAEAPPWKSQAIHVYYSAGAVAAQLLLVGWILPLEALREGAQASPGAAHFWVLGTVPFLTLLFLLLHYGFGGVSLWLQGHSAGEIRERLLRHGVLAECLQIPLSMAVVQVFDPTRPFNFLLLGTTFLLINAVFRKLTQTSASLRQRVAELTTLNDVGRAMNSTLQLDELLQQIARSTLSALERATVLTVGLWNEKEHAFRFRAFTRGEDAPADRWSPRGEGVTAWVLQNKAPLLVRDLAGEADTFSIGPLDVPSGIRSWMGVPLVVYDEIVGILSVHSLERSAFGDDDLRLLESIGQQAAAAIENARLYELATVDGLTQLYVRRYFDQRLDEEWRRSARYHTPFALILIDLDDFKALNDRYGHPVGDRVLRATAGIVKRKMRAIDIPARYGGEEFAILLSRATTADAMTVANRIRADIAAYRLPVGDGEVSITASLGVASYPECGDVDALELLHRADLALYEAKEAGKNRVCAYRAAQRSRVKLL